MAEYIISEKALDDLNNIWIYTAENWSVEQANRYEKLLTPFLGELEGYEVTVTIDFNAETSQLASVPKLPDHLREKLKQAMKQL